MPEPLQASEVNSKTDPSVAKQWDTETPMNQQIDEFYKMVDKLGCCLLTTERPGIGPVSRSMALSRRDGPDFLFLANKHSAKFSDIEHSKTAQVTFQDSSSQNWASITGEITKADSNDKLVKELYKPIISAWLGDLKDGVHKGNAEDPRMAVIVVKAKYITYWLSTVGKLGFAKEVGQAALTGQVAQNGVTRQFREEEIASMRTLAK
ncbi:MAG: hypothetical protein M1828_004740 [Chrysothrix sp. TS-e1954]|nr:MAG: hypothetical protein M1828_004740 [Chrysothrix sp. TS-e1954]